MINNIFQAKYEASKLKEFRSFDNAEKLVSTYMKTGLLVYPHQIVAALAAMEDPLRKGFILADEVGLGKGIEAMLVVSQYYHDGKKICIVVPSPLLSMWKELIENKFGLPLVGEENVITLITYTAAVEKADELKDKFDFVVFEEAHRLRKFHTGENKTASILHGTFENVKKLLLTATPMQKNVMDLYGLVIFIDSDALSDADEFYKRYYKKPENYAELKELIAPYIFRTLRSQVKTDVNLPERNVLTYAYKLENPKEKELNDKLLKYLSKSKKIAFPEMDSYELTLMLEKIFSSSIYALSKTIAGVIVRLRKMGTKEAQDEAAELEELLNLATSITQTSKGKVFLKALETAMKGLKDNDFNKKAIIFTENTETQKYLAKLLQEKTNYKVAVYNGTTGEEPIEQFRAKANILIATDNASEGFNFDFCNLVINYDNLWLASAIEQRIGRCHRIGQKSDVMVINFLCTELLADVRFYELAYKRLNMFGGILGATDDVVSNISSGEIESRIKETLSATRNSAQTEKDYSDATQELTEEIENNKQNTNELFFRTFDGEIAKKTQNYAQLIKEKSIELKDRLWDLAKFALKDYANFNENNRSFSLTKSVFKSGNYTISPYEIDYDKIFDINYIDAQTDLDELFKRAVSMKTVLVRKQDDTTSLKDKLTALNNEIESLSSISSFESSLLDEIKKYDGNMKLKLSSKDIAIDPYKTIYPYLQRDDGARYYVSGDGMRKITSYSLHRLIALKNQKQKITVFLVEEPENHLHKTTLLKLSQVLFKENEFPYLFLTTHSSELLAEMDRINLVRVASANKIYSHFYTVPDDYQKVKKMLNSNLARALFYDRVLLVEGPSEVMLFDAVLTHKCKYKIKGLEILPVNGIAFDEYLNVLIPLNIKTFVKTDNDRTKTGTTLGLNRIKKLGKRVAELNGDAEKKAQIDAIVINVNEKQKPALYDANTGLIELCKSLNIYLSKSDLEIDLAEALGDTLAVRLCKDSVDDAIEYLKESKLYNMIELTGKLTNDDFDSIYVNSNFAVLGRFINGIL